MEPSKDCITDPSIDDYELNRLYNHYRRCSYYCPTLAIDESLCNAEKEGIIDANTRKGIEDWFGQLCKGESSSKDIFQQFRTLVTTSLTPRDFTRLCERIEFSACVCIESCHLLSLRRSLRSSDHVVLEMKKSAAISQSVVLGDLFDCIPNAGHDDEDEIPVEVPSLVLPKIISFCNKNHKFNSIIEGAVEHLKVALNRLKGTVHDYKTWITGFVKSNKPLFSHLHQAADYLHIPALLELTSMAVGDMKESPVQEISDWYAGLSIPRMLSPLGIQAYSTLSQLDFFS